jgi:hypothetical protein
MERSKQNKSSRKLRLNDQHAYIRDHFLFIFLYRSSLTLVNILPPGDSSGLAGEGVVQLFILFDRGLFGKVVLVDARHSHVDVVK